jgi:hypothetical protein
MLEDADRTHKIVKAIIDHYGNNFVGKKIIDFGSGSGDILAALCRNGAIGIAIDARQSNLDIIHRKHPFIRTMLLDFDSDNWPFADQKFDFALSISTLSHLQRAEAHLERILSLTENLVLETEVLDSPDPTLRQPIYEEKSVAYLSASGLGSLISAQNIQNRLSSLNATYKRIDNPKLNNAYGTYDWKEQNAGRKFGNNRFFFVRRDGWWANRPQQQTTPLELNNAEPLVITGDNKMPIMTRTVRKIEPVPPAASPMPQMDYPVNLKVAVCIAGHMRMFDKTHNSFFKKIITRYGANTDFFVHTWETLEGLCKCSGCRGTREHITQTNTFNRLNDINAIFRPKKIVVDRYDIKDRIKQETRSIAMTKEDLNGFFNGNLIEYYAMLYSWNQTRIYMQEYENEHKFQYDVVIRLRPDLLFDTGLDVANFRMKHNIYLPNIATYYPRGACNDQFAIGDNQSMKSYLSLYERVSAYLNSKVIKSPTPEKMLYHHIISNGIKLNTISMRYLILRSSGKFLAPHGISMIESDDQNAIKRLL